MEIIWLIPLRHHVGTGCFRGFNYRPSIRAVVRINIDNAIATGLGKNRLDVGNALFAVAFRHQRHIFSTNRLSKGSAPLVPRGMVRIGQRTN